MLSQLKDALNRKKNSMKVEDKYTEAQMKLSQDVLRILFKKFGNGDYSNRSIYECADEWVEKYNVSFGVVDYYNAYKQSFINKSLE